MQYLGDSLHFLRSAFQETAGLLIEYRRALRALPQTSETIEAIARLTEAEAAVDWPYIETQMPEAFDRTFEAVDRVANIVRAIKDFARPAQEQMVPADLNQAITDALVVGKNELRFVANVQTDLADLPRVTCHIGDISQVLLNILVNAGHAIADIVGTSGSMGLVQVRTRRVDNDVVISISDTGRGVSPDIRAHIFEPFFTTKGTRGGTGQGLAISRAIVEKHGGSLTFDTQLEHGTSFHIRLPISGP